MTRRSTSLGRSGDRPVLLEGAADRGRARAATLARSTRVRRPRRDLGNILRREEYRLTRGSRAPEAHVALMDGIAMGGGVGLAAHGSQI